MLRSAILGIAGLIGQLGVKTSLSKSGLRVLAYHAVHDGGQFKKHLEYLVRTFSTVGASEAIQIINGDISADRPIWITFDDGDPSVVETALPLLNRYDVQATLFVCPGLVDSDRPFWWEIVEEAARLCVQVNGVPVNSGDLVRLKLEPDIVRRQEVDEMLNAVETALGNRMVRRQITSEELAIWVDAGHTVGSHTWDHPLLDRCEKEEQRRQIQLAHDWLQGREFLSHRLFAYPNGNATSTARAALEDLDYSVALLFDHEVDYHHVGLNVSRIRVNDHDSKAEYRARTTGAHSTLNRLLVRGVE